MTNEGGVCDTIRLLKNIAGLWIIQECWCTWRRPRGKRCRGMTSCLHAAARVAIRLHRSMWMSHDFLDPANALADPGVLPRTGHAGALEGVGPIARIVYESLALKYRRVLEMMEDPRRAPTGVLHIVGGGAAEPAAQPAHSGCYRPPGRRRTVRGHRSRAICCCRLLATGAVGSLAEGRALVRRSFDTETYHPTDAGVWNDAYARFSRLPQ